jgi:hypothetical protein
MDIPAIDEPDAILDAIRAHPEWSDRRRDELLDRLVSGFPAEALSNVARRRLGDLSQADGEIVLRLIEASASPPLLDELARALRNQPDLAPDRAWDALALLDGADWLEANPDLAERWEELNETIDDDQSLAELIEQLEGDSEGIWLALQGLGAIEPEVRGQIIEGIGELPLGPGLIEFLRLLSFSHDPLTRTAALAALDRPPDDSPGLVAAWAAIAADHPEPAIAERARGWLGREADRAIEACAGPDRLAPQLVRSLITVVDGKGQASIVLSSIQGPARATAAFLCDVRYGIGEAVGQLAEGEADSASDFNEFTRLADRDFVEGAHEYALQLLGGCLQLCGPKTSPVVRYWLETTLGPGFRPHPFVSAFPGWDPDSVPQSEISERASAVLASCPTWLDRSELTYEIAEELALREGDPDPDPKRDTGAYRYLFEHRLQGRLEFYRRMLFWMASFWEASGDDDLGRSALALAWQLSDPQHAVPSHSFTVALTTRSLTAAQATLGTKLDPRRRTKKTPGV